MRVPSLQYMIDLYGLSMELTLDARRFQVQVEQLKRLALNAEVLAVHSGSQGDVFQTIAREIGRLSLQVTDVISELIESVAQVAERAIRSASMARRCERYDKAMKIGVLGATEGDISKQFTFIGADLLEDLHAIRSNLLQTGGNLQDVGRLQIQLPMIATLLNIEANRYLHTDQALGANAKYLLQLKTSLSELLEQVVLKNQQTLEYLDRFSD